MRSCHELLELSVRRLHRGDFETSQLYSSNGIIQPVVLPHPVASTLDRDEGRSLLDGLRRQDYQSSEG